MGVVTITELKDLDYQKLTTSMIVVHETFPGLNIKKMLIANKLNRNALTLVLTKCRNQEATLFMLMNLLKSLVLMA